MSLLGMSKGVMAGDCAIGTYQNSESVCTVPPGVTAMKVVAIGGGGKGGLNGVFGGPGHGGQGGGGGKVTATIFVTPGHTLSLYYDYYEPGETFIYDYDSDTLLVLAGQGGNGGEGVNGIGGDGGNGNGGNGSDGDGGNLGGQGGMGGKNGLGGSGGNGGGGGFSGSDGDSNGGDYIGSNGGDGGNGSGAGNGYGHGGHGGQGEGGGGGGGGGGYTCNGYDQYGYCESYSFGEGGGGGGGGSYGPPGSTFEVEDNGGAPRRDAYSDPGGGTGSITIVSMNGPSAADSHDPNDNPKANAQAQGTDSNASGQCPAVGSASKDPVDLATGYYYDTLNLMQVSAPGAPLSFSLNYSSGNPEARGSGYGWGHNYRYSLAEQTPSVTVTWPDGHTSVFSANGSGGYISSAAHAADTLVKNADDTYTLTDQRQKTYSFDVTGKLIRITDRIGFIRNLSYVNGNLYRVTDTLSGRYLQFDYDDQSRVNGVSCTGAGSVSLGYDATTGDLLSVTDPRGNQTTFTYDSNHRLLTKTNALGDTLVTNTYDTTTDKVTSQDDGLPVTPLEEFSYGLGSTSYTDSIVNNLQYTFDNRFKVLSIVDSLDNTTAYTYDSATEMKNSETDALNNVTQWSYDAAGYVLSRIDALGHTARYTYDSAHNIVTHTDEAGNVTRFTYDSHHNILTKTDPAKKVTTYTYNAQGLLATAKNPNGGVTSYVYDGKGQVTSRIDPAGLATTYTYDDAGRVLTITDGAGKIWTRTYDRMGNVLTSADPLGNTNTYTYDALNRMTTKTDPNGGMTIYGYDIHSNLTSVTDPLGGVTNYSYDAMNRQIGAADALDRTTTLTRDANGRVTATTDPLSNTSQLSYDAVGNLVSTTDPKGNVTLMTYDALHRLTNITDPLSHQTQSSFDAINQVIAKTDPKGAVTSFAYDALSRLTKVTDPVGGISAQSFDANGNRLSLTDAEGNKTTFTYDSANRIKSITAAGSGSMNYTYNNQNLIATATNGRGQIATYAYDAAGRLVSTSDPAGTIAYTYDASGNLLTAGDAVGTIQYAYDANNRVIHYTDVYGKGIGYQYDSVDNLTQLTYPDGKVVTYTYDANNRITSVADWANRVTSYTYDETGRVTAIQRHNRTGGVYAYNASGELTSLSETFPTTANNYQTIYSYDDNGNITSEESTIPPAIPTTTTKTLTYSDGNKLVNQDGQATVFDADGNMTTGPLNGSAATFTYDARSRLTSIGNNNYVYDAQEHRVAVTDTGVTTRYVIAPNAPLSLVLMETTDSGTPIAHYVYGPMGLIARVGTDGIYKTYHYDYRGSTLKLADESGAITDSYGYSPFGALATSSGATPNPFRYNGRDGVISDSNGLYYMRARYYAPSIQRFINRDTLLGDVTQGATLNRFAYVLNNPIHLIDPSGLTSESTPYSNVGSVAKEVLPLLEAAENFGAKALSKAGAAIDAVAALVYLDNLPDYRNAAVGDAISGGTGALTAATNIRNNLNQANASANRRPDLCNKDNDIRPITISDTRGDFDPGWFYELFYSKSNK